MTLPRLSSAMLATALLAVMVDCKRAAPKPGITVDGVDTADARQAPPPPPGLAIVLRTRDLDAVAQGVHRLPIVAKLAPHGASVSVATVEQGSVRVATIFAAPTDVARRAALELAEAANPGPSASAADGWFDLPGAWPSDGASSKEGWHAVLVQQGQVLVGCDRTFVASVAEYLRWKLALGTRELRGPAEVEVTASGSAPTLRDFVYVRSKLREDGLTGLPLVSDLAFPDERIVRAFSRLGHGRIDVSLGPLRLEGSSTAGPAPGVERAVLADVGTRFHPIVLHDRPIDDALRGALGGYLPTSPETRSLAAMLYDELAFDLAFAGCALGEHPAGRCFEGGIELFVVREGAAPEAALAELVRKVFPTAHPQPWTEEGAKGLFFHEMDASLGPPVSRFRVLATRGNRLFVASGTWSTSFISGIEFRYVPEPANAGTLFRAGVASAIAEPPPDRTEFDLLDAACPPGSIVFWGSGDCAARKGDRVAFRLTGR